MKNCLTFAVASWWLYGGHIRVRRSLLAEDFDVPWWHPFHLVPHFLHVSPNGIVMQYAPTQKQREEWRQGPQWRAWLRLWHFEGQIMYGDREWEILKGLR